MPSELFEYKSTSLGNSLSSKGGNINLDEAQGIVECFVAGIGNKDSVGDIVASGAFAKSLQRRKPRVVWGHSWNDPIGKVLEIYEVPNTDNRLPLKMKMAGIGGLFARVQFNLNSEKGREAFAMVAFFGEEQEWSIGYKTLRAQFDQKSQANVIYELELYEVSPVLHGANQLTGTISVKSDDNAGGVMMAMIEDDEDAIDKAEIEKQLAAILGAKVSLMDVNDDEITFARRMDNGEVGRYKCGFSGNRGRYMFGPPQPIVVMPTRKPVAPMQNMPMVAPGVPANEPQRVIRPSQMPAMPVAIKPGENGNRMVPLPPVQYEDMDDERNQPEFDKNNLDQEETDLRDALLKIVKRHGRFNEDSDGVWAGYKPAAENPVAAIGVKCANCVFYQGGNSCKIIAMDVEPEGKCRFAVIPKGVVDGDTASKKTYELDEEFNEEDYIADLEVKYPGELAVASLRGVVGRRRKKRRKFKLLSEFGSTKDDDFDYKPYLLPVVPQFAFQVKQALDPIFDYHNVDSFVDVNGIVITSGVSFELIEAIDTAVDNLKKKSLGENGIEWKAAGYRLGRAIGNRLIDRPNIGGGRSRGRFFTSIGAEDFDPFTARDANLNGVVGEGLFLRGVPLATPDPTPDGPGSIRNPKPSRAQVSKPESEFVQPVFREDGMKPKKPKYDGGPYVDDGKPAKDKIRLSSGAIPLDLPRVDDPDIDSATKYGAAESQRDELQGVLDEATDADQIKKLKKAIADLDKYMNRVEKMAEDEIAEADKPKKKPKQPQVLDRNTPLSRGRKPEFVAIPDEKPEVLDRNTPLSRGRKPEFVAIPDEKPEVLDRNTPLSRGRKPEFVAIPGETREARRARITAIMQQDQDREGDTRRAPRTEAEAADTQMLSSGYAKYLSKPKEKRTNAEVRKFDGPIGAALSSGKLPDKAEIPEDSPILAEMYKRMAEEIIEVLQDLIDNPDKTKQWKMPWRNPEIFARNPTKNRVYQGMNQLALLLTAQSRGYKTNRWAGRTQWEKLGGKLKPGASARGVSILVPRDGRTVINADGQAIQMGRYYVVQTVYNVDDVSNLPNKYYEVEDTDINQEQRLQDIENVIQEIGPAFVESKGQQAFYRPSTDKIHMPAFEQFENALAFYGTAMHETIHWTSHPTRLNRTLGREFGDDQYAFEELIAEIGSAFAMGSMGLEPTVREDHLLYLNSWLKKLRSDPLAIHRAIVQAQQANDYLLNRSATMRRLAGIPDDERKGKEDSWYEVPMLAGYEDAEQIKPVTTIVGPMEDLIDSEAWDDFVPSSPSERELARSLEGLPAKNKDGVVITPSGALSSGKQDGPISGTPKGKKQGVADIERIDEKVSLGVAFGLKDEPTNEQRDIIAVAMSLIHKRNPAVFSVLAGAGTGKTTTLKSIAWALQREFQLWPEGDVRRAEQLAYLSDTYGVDFSKIPADKIEETVADLAKANKTGNIFYTVFNTKNQLEAEVEFPKNTGIATTDKLWQWSLRLGQGDARYGKGMRRKLVMLNKSRDSKKSMRRNPKWKSEEETPDVEKMIGKNFVRETFDGTIETFVGEDPGLEALGWVVLESGEDFVKHLEIDKWPNQKKKKKMITVVDTTGKPVLNEKGKKTKVEVEVDGFELPNGQFVELSEMGDLLANALRRWGLSKEEKVTAKHFMQPKKAIEDLDTPRGHGKSVAPVDSIMEESQIPKKWIDAVQSIVDQISDGDSNVMPSMELIAKLWMMTDPDLRTDPGLITHSSNQTKAKVAIPSSLSEGDTYVADGEEWVVTTISDKAGKTSRATLRKKVATSENPLGAFMVDESQDTNEVLETVLDRNRDKLPIIIVGDDRQAVYAFRDSKNILESLQPEYAQSITESFRYGGVIGHVTNLVLGGQNLHLTKQGVPQPVAWKHVKGQAQTVINRQFDPLLPKEDRRGNFPVEELDDATRELLIAKIEKKYSSPTEKLNISSLSRKEQDKALKELRDKLYAPKEGRIVDRYEEADKGNLPTMILCRTNAEIINEALKFINIVINSKAVKRDERGMPKLPEVIIPASKWEQLVTFTKHLDFINRTPQQQRDYVARFGKPQASGWLGNVWTPGALQKALAQTRYQQARSAYNLIMKPPKNDPTAKPLGTKGMLELLQGTVVKGVHEKGKAKGKPKIDIIPAVLIPERKTMELDNWNVGVDQIKEIAGRQKAAWKASPTQREKLFIIPNVDDTFKQAVYAALEIEGGSDKSPGKATGRIIITGDGVDTGRPIERPDGSQAVNTPPGGRGSNNGRYRRDLEKAIIQLGLQDKIEIMQEAERGFRIEGQAGRRHYDGFVIKGETLEESTEILAQISQALRDAAKTPGGDVEITTMQLSKGRESRFVAVAEDMGDPSQNLPGNLAQGEAGIGFMEEGNLVHVAFSRAKEMLDPGNAGFFYYLHDERTKAIRDAMKQAVVDGHIPPELDRGAFGDKDGIPLPDWYKAINAMSLSDLEDGFPARPTDEKDDEDIVVPVPVDDGDSEEVEGIITEIDEEDYEFGEDGKPGEDDFVLPEGDDDDEVVDEGDIGDVLGMTLSSGATRGGNRRITRRSRRISGSNIYSNSLSAQQLAGLRINGDPNSSKNRQALQFAMQAWDGVRRRGIAIDVDDDTLSVAQRQAKTRSAMQSVGQAMKDRQNRVRVGRVSDNSRNENPSAETWMLSVDTLADTIRIPTEFTREGFEGESTVRWTQSRPATRDEIAKMLGLSPADAAKMSAPDAGINHDAVRLLIAELGKRPELAAWRYFAPVTADEAKRITPSPDGDVVEDIPQVDLASENAGRANMRDRFIIETFGKDAFPHWFDVEENQSMTPEEYVNLGEVSETSKFRASGRFYPDSAIRGDSEAEVDIYGESFDSLLPEEGSLDASGDVIRMDKTSIEDFDLDSLIEYLGIDKKEWKKGLQERLSAAFGTDSIGINDEWRRTGIPTATIAHMIRTGVLPDAKSVWKEADSGERLDGELKRSKYVVYEALIDFIDKSFPKSSLNIRENKNKIIGAQDLGYTLNTAASNRGSVWTPSKGNEPRFSTGELQSMVDRFNEVFGTNHTIDDIFSEEQLRTAKERIESGNTLSKKTKN